MYDPTIRPVVLNIPDVLMLFDDTFSIYRVPLSVSVPES